MTKINYNFKINKTSLILIYTHFLTVSPRVVEVDWSIPNSSAIESLSKSNSKYVIKWFLVPSTINEKPSSSISFHPKEENPSRFYLRSSEEQKQVEFRYAARKFLRY